MKKPQNGENLPIRNSTAEFLIFAKEAGADRTNLSFTDKSQPELAAFYDIEVRAYVEEPIQSDGGIEMKSEIDPETLTIGVKLGDM